jgi:magnesium transporter
VNPGAGHVEPGASPLRIFQISRGEVLERTQLPDQHADGSFWWVACSHVAFETRFADLQTMLATVCGTQLVDLHISDLRNQQLPSRYDYTAQYDLMVFRRLASSHGQGHAQPAAAPRRGGPPVLRRIDTTPVGFAIFDNLLLTVHPSDCSVRDVYAARLLAAASDPARGAGLGARLPTSAPDLMLRIVNLMVDGYLDLRRELSRQLDHWQAELLSPRTRFSNWTALLEARLALHALEEISDDQRAALQDWIGALAEWPQGTTPTAQKEHDLLRVRSRDVLEHIERVVRHVHRLEQNIETTVQIHFNAQSNRTNEIMRTLTALTAVFLPLNLITGFFGMNFEFLPLIHRQGGLWWAVGIMATVGATFALYLWRKRFLARTNR